MRVLMITPDFPPGPGGIQILSHRLAQHATAWKTRVVTSRAGSAERFDAEHPFEVRRARALERSHRASVLLLSARALLEAARFGPDAIVNMHIVTAPAAWVAARLLGVPFVQYLHASEVDFRPRLAAFAVRRARATVAVSAHTAGLALAAGAARERVHTIPPGVDVPHELPETRAERPTVVTVARLDDRFKGHDVMLDALPRIRARVADVQWVVVGGGSLRDELEGRAAELRLGEAVRFVGAVPDDERDRWLERAHVFAMPSRRPRRGGGEGFGIAYLEAGARGLPVVAGGVAGALDAVVDGETGVLVDPEDVSAVAAAIAGLLTEPGRARELGRRGRERAREHDWPRVAHRLENLVESVVGA